MVVLNPACKATLLSMFYGKQSRNVISCLVSRHRRPKLYTFALRTRVVRSLLSELDLHGGTDTVYFF